MARTRGSRNVGYEEQRLALARAVRQALMEDEGIHASLRELAATAKTSVATLKHYFGDRQGLLQAVMEVQRADSAPFLAMAAQAKPGDVRASLLQFLSGFAGAWTKYSVGKMISSTLAVGLGTRALGPSYVNHVLEPMLQTGESLLRQHLERGELVIDDVRHASLMLLSPAVFALLHQDSLSGVKCRPLDVPRFFETHVDAFLRAFGPPNLSPSPRNAGRAPGGDGVGRGRGSGRGAVRASGSSRAASDGEHSKRPVR